MRVCVQVMMHIAGKLQQLHLAGWVHQDLKPGNCIWLPSQNSWTLIDFGCAARAGALSSPQLDVPAGLQGRGRRARGTHNDDTTSQHMHTPHDMRGADRSSPHMHAPLPALWHPGSVSTTSVAYAFLFALRRTLCMLADCWLAGNTLRHHTSTMFQATTVMVA
jgi:serine/threonine protein kinase